MNNEIQEGLAKLSVGISEKISKKLPVFYNPVMKLNRDLSVILLNSVIEEKLQVADIMGASGIRSIRFLKELSKEKIKKININDLSERSVAIIKKNIIDNNLDSDERVEITQKDANQFLLESTGFDYIEVDPFGTPNPFLDSAVIRLSRRGLLAVTATDTAPLSGTYPLVCKRKYWAVPMRNELMHEVGIRILIRKIQLIGAQYEKALAPIFCHSNDHYMRIYFQCMKSKKAVDDVMKQHKYLLYCPKCMVTKYSEYNQAECHGKMQYAGPLYSGKLWDVKLADKMLSNSQEEIYAESNKLLRVISDESKVDCQWHCNIHVMAKKLKLKIPRTEDLLSRIKTAGFSAARTHFSDKSIRTDMPIEKLIELMK